MVQDIFSNFYIDPVRFNKTNVFNSEKGSNDNGHLMCDMHLGYHDAYINSEYQKSVEGFLHNWKAEYPDCFVVLAGHSKDGGITGISGFQLTYIMSYAITFGAPK